MSSSVRIAVRIEGVVQGVGFRPFVHALASRLELAGHVGNDSDGVFVEIEGTRGAATQFLESVRTEAPALAVVDSIATRELAPTGALGFAIAPSPHGGVSNTLVSADSATCPDCLREMWDPADRRYQYPFVNCTNCGPRFSIVRSVPYDRPRTTMAEFTMCSDCAREYSDPTDRRFHAQPVCCPACGPTLRVLVDGNHAPGDPVASTVELLNAGKIVAIKGIGGYHLAVDATNEDATAALRGRKHREDKPFAVMTPTVEQARRLCVVDSVAERLLTDRRGPVVLMPKLASTPVATAVAPGNRQLGVMLPYTPLHHLLLHQFARPVVLTSGNVSDEPIAYTDDAAQARLREVADAFLMHDRGIHIRTDDSVVRPFRGGEQVQRRSRGYVPEPVIGTFEFARPVLACGAELKNTFCMAKGRRAFVSHHIGDLENYETLRSFTEGIEHFGRLFDIRPEVVAHDLHPDYLSTKYARDLSDVELVGVQHHHAHIASCLADNGEEGPVLGVAFDGTGYGLDGTVWGGEFLLADLHTFERLGQLHGVPMPGGAAAIKQPWRMAIAYLDAAYAGRPPPEMNVLRRHDSALAGVRSMVRAEMNTPTTSSAGRLFDAVAALLGVRDTVNYEGQAAIELEQQADPAESGRYRAEIDEGDTLGVRGTDLVRASADDLAEGVPVSSVAARFHNGVVDAIRRCCARLGDQTGVRTVALSGGVFQNLLLLEATVSTLRDDGFRVLSHARVPTNDGGISLGQAVVAAATAGGT